MSKVELKNIDKSNWKTFRFDQFAEKVSETIDPKTTDLKIYVGLEHLDSESIHIKRKGSPSDVSGGKLRCYPGDIIFGKRRAYQRKAAIVDFDGICSAHAFVLRAIPEVIDPKLFPFFLHSDLFMHRAVDISVGGLSPTINWTHLREQEFILPPKDQQAEIADLFWAIDYVTERNLDLIQSFKQLLLVQLKEVFKKSDDRIPLIELCVDKPKYGSNSKAIEFDNNVRYIRITDIGEFSSLNKEKVSSNKHEDKYLLSYGDFLIARSADPGRSYYYKESDGVCSYAGYLIKFKLNLKKILPEFLYFFTHTLEYKLWITQTTRKGTLSNINSQEFSKLKVPVMSLDQQEFAIKKITDLYSKLELIKDKFNSSENLKSSLVNKVF